MSACSYVYTTVTEGFLVRREPTSDATVLGCLPCHPLTMPGATSGAPLGFVHLPSLQAFVHPDEQAKIIRVTQNASVPVEAVAASAALTGIGSLQQRLKLLGVSKLGDRLRIISELSLSTFDDLECALRLDPSLGGRVQVLVAGPASPQLVGGFVISLAGASSRRRHATDAVMPRLEGLDTSAVLWDAVNGCCLRPDEQALVASPSKHHMLSGRLRRGEYVHFERPLSRGEVGCMLSHVAVLREIVRRRLPWAIVLEDDVYLPPDFVQRTRLAISCVPSSAAAPLLYLGHGVAFRLEDEEPGEATAEMEVGVQGVHAEAPRVRRAEYAFCTHAMAISLAAAQRLLQGATPVDKPADHHFVLAAASGAVQAYVCDPQLATLSSHSAESILHDAGQYSCDYAKS